MKKLKKITALFVTLMFLTVFLTAPVFSLDDPPSPTPATNTTTDPTTPTTDPTTPTTDPTTPTTDPTTPTTDPTTPTTDPTTPTTDPTTPTTDPTTPTTDPTTPTTDPTTPTTDPTTPTTDPTTPTTDPTNPTPTPTPAGEIYVNSYQDLLNKLAYDSNGNIVGDYIMMNDISSFTGNIGAPVYQSVTVTQPTPENPITTYSPTPNPAWGTDPVSGAPLDAAGTPITASGSYCWELAHPFVGSFDGDGNCIIGLASNMFYTVNGAAMFDIGFENTNVPAGKGIFSNALAVGASNPTVINSYINAQNTNFNYVAGVANTDIETPPTLTPDVPYAYNTPVEFWFNETTLNWDLLLLPQKVGTVFMITDQDDWNVIARLINSGTTTYENLPYAGMFYELDTDIVVDSALIPWGKKSEHPFSGDFYGNGCTISGAPGDNRVPALFVFASFPNANQGFHEFGVEIGKITGLPASENSGGAIGGIVATMTGGTMDHCYFVGEITDRRASWVGGLCGYSSGAAFKYCYTQTVGDYGSGLVYYLSGGSIENCYTTQASGTITFNNNSRIVNSYTSEVSSSERYGVRRLTDMAKPNFLAALNKLSTGILGTDYVYAGNQNPPMLRGVGVGRTYDPTIQPNFLKVTIVAPTYPGCTFTVTDGSIKLINGDFVVKNTILTFSNSTTNSTGFLFRNYVVNNQAQAGNTFEVLSDVTVSAYFEQTETYKITVNAGKGGNVKMISGGSASADGKTITVNKNGYAIFRIVPETGYKTSGVSYTGASITKNTSDTFTTSSVVRNETLTVTFSDKLENVTKVEITNEGTVITVKSPTDIIDLINDGTGSIFIAPLPKNGMLDNTVLEAMRGQNVRLTLTAGNYEWIIYGKNISGGSLNSVNMTVATGKSIDDKYLTSLKKFKDTTQFQLAHEGSFPFTATLRLNVGNAHAGRQANLFYFNRNRVQLEMYGASKIDSKGYTSFNFSHASEYVIVIYDKVLTYSDLTTQAGADEVKVVFINDTKKSLAVAAGMIGVVMIIGIIVAFVIFRKPKDDDYDDFSDKYLK